VIKDLAQEMLCGFTRWGRSIRTLTTTTIHTQSVAMSFNNALFKTVLSWKSYWCLSWWQVRCLLLGLLQLKPAVITAGMVDTVAGMEAATEEDISLVTGRIMGPVTVDTRAVMDRVMVADTATMDVMVTMGLPEASMVAGMWVIGIGQLQHSAGSDTDESQSDHWWNQPVRAGRWAGFQHGWHDWRISTHWITRNRGEPKQEREFHRRGQASAESEGSWNRRSRMIDYFQWSCISQFDSWLDVATCSLLTEAW
jgi:hypothetical protein